LTIVLDIGDTLYGVYSIEYSIHHQTSYKMYILGLRLQYIKSTISTSSQICFSFLSDVSDRNADPLPVPVVPVVGISPWVSSHLHLPLNSPPFISPRERIVYVIRTNPQ
jgi:hypothetical protein